MFSGIKSIFFGEPETENSTAGNRDESALSNNSFKPADTSALLEQTLNAATTKFTEQLLPQSPSIEQLQSSSHQLLPTLTEQREEDQNKKKQQLEAEKSMIRGNDNDVFDVDDSSSNADSWELLDLVENPEVTGGGSLNSTIHDNSVKSKAGGILKQNSNNNKNISNDVDQGAQQRLEEKQQRQKQKVSFEAPDLVKGKQKIEMAAPKDNSGRATENKKERKNDHANSGTATAIGPLSLSTSMVPRPRNHHQRWDNANKRAVTRLIDRNYSVASSSLSYAQVVQSNASRYAPRLDGRTGRGSTRCSFNPAIRVSDYNKYMLMQSYYGFLENEILDYGQERAARDVQKKAQEDAQKSQEDDQKKARSTALLEEEACPRENTEANNDEVTAAQDDDKESILSSAEDDREYGPEYWNFYHSYKEKSRQKGTPKFTSMAKLRRERQKMMKNVEQDCYANQQHQTSLQVATKPAFATSMKHKQSPRKKKMTSLISSTSSNTSADLTTSPGKALVYGQKPSLPNVIDGPAPQGAHVPPFRYDDQVRKESAKLTAAVTAPPPASIPAPETSPHTVDAVACPLLSSHLMPPPAALTAAMGSSSASGNDSSDITDMDDSWYVTPPSCFTGSNKDGREAKPIKVKESDRENALIEHPSIYIASTSKQNNDILASSDFDRIEPLAGTVSRGYVLKKLGEKSRDSSTRSERRKKKSFGRYISSPAELEDEVITPEPKARSTITATTNASPKVTTLAAAALRAQQPAEKKDAKAWENKFIVTNWDYDEQDDINDDFDNLFETDDLQQSSPKVKKTKAKGKQRVDRQRKSVYVPEHIRADSPFCPFLEDDDDYVKFAACIDEKDELLSPSVEMVEQESIVMDSSPQSPDYSISTNDENLEPSVASSKVDGDFEDEILSSEHKNGEKPLTERRAPIQVRPIKPERQPGWQLRRKRPRRRPLSTSLSMNAVAGMLNGKRRSSLVSSKSQPILRRPQNGVSGSNSQQLSEASSGSGNSIAGSQPASARSSPTLIDRIGSSIVANLTNLTSGAFPSAGVGLASSQNAQRAAIQEAERLNQSVAKRSNSEVNLFVRKRMSKGYLERQNDCSRSSNLNRRPDRRFKMYTTPNGSSVNRKVHANFH